MKFLMLRLEGPIQAWGEKSLWDERDTGKAPTKSGVVGLISACMGLKRDSDKIPLIYDKSSVSVRIDDPGYLMRDYQTIQNTLKNDGKINKHMVISPRYYLMTASFLVAVRIKDENLFKEIEQALKNPFWTPYIGRKACIPSIPVYCGTIEANTAIEALMNKGFKVRHYQETGNYIEMIIENDDDNQLNNTYEKREVYGKTRFPKIRTVYDKFVKIDMFEFLNVFDEVS